MPAVCLTFNAHLPLILRRYSVFDTDLQYFDNYKSREIFRRYATQSLLPTNRILVSLLRRFAGRFKINLSLSGLLLDLLEHYTPDVIDSFRELTETRGAELLATPYHQGLAFLYSPEEFADQVALHRKRTGELFDQQPRVLRNTELIYGPVLAETVERLGFVGMLAESCVEALGGRSLDSVYVPPGGNLRVLLRNAGFSRDIGERFMDRNWDQWPLTAPKLAGWMGDLSGRSEVISIDLEYATFGLDHGADTGIFDFLRYLPEKTLDHPHLGFITASEVCAHIGPAGEYQVSRYVSRIERGGDLAAWLGNPLQSDAMHRLYALGPEVQSAQADDPTILADWRILQAADYFLEMSTRTGSRGVVPAATYGPDSPYDAYINFMNICDNIESRCRAVGRVRLEPGRDAAATAG